MKTKFSPGDIVTVIPFKRDGTILECLPNGSYKVTLGNLPVTITEEQLVLSTNKKSSKRTNVPKEYTVVRASGDYLEKETLDLHGVTVLEAISLVEQKINRAVLSDLHRVKLVHGLGSGALRSAIHTWLSECSIVASFKLDEYNQGVTWVYL